MKQNPIYEQGRYWCPICDRHITNKVTKHPHCGIEFNWSENTDKEEKHEI